MSVTCFRAYAFSSDLMYLLQESKENSSLGILPPYFQICSLMFQEPTDYRLNRLSGKFQKYSFTSPNYMKQNEIYCQVWSIHRFSALVYPKISCVGPASDLLPWFCLGGFRIHYWGNTVMPRTLTCGPAQSDSCVTLWLIIFFFRNYYSSFHLFILSVICLSAYLPTCLVCMHVHSHSHTRGTEPCRSWRKTWEMGSLFHLLHLLTVSKLLGWLPKLQAPWNVHCCHLSSQWRSLSTLTHTITPPPLPLQFLSLILITCTWLITGAR